MIAQVRSTWSRWWHIGSLWKRRCALLRQQRRAKVAPSKSSSTASREAWDERKGGRGGLSDGREDEWMKGWLEGWSDWRKDWRNDGLSEGIRFYEELWLEFSHICTIFRNVLPLFDVLYFWHYKQNPQHGHCSIKKIIAAINGAQTMINLFLCVEKWDPYRNKSWWRMRNQYR